MMHPIVYNCMRSAWSDKNRFSVHVLTTRACNNYIWQILTRRRGGLTRCQNLSRTRAYLSHCLLPSWSGSHSKRSFQDVKYLFHSLFFFKEMTWKWWRKNAILKINFVNRSLFVHLYCKMCFICIQRVKYDTRHIVYILQKHTWNSPSSSS